MNCKLYPELLVILILTITFSSSAQSVLNEKNPVRISEAGGDAAWYSNVVSNIEKSTYRFYPNTTTQHFHAVNLQQKNGFDLSSETFTVHNIRSQANESLWNISLTLEGIEKGNSALRPKKRAKIISEEGYLAFQYPSFRIEYKNAPDGLRQNFIIGRKPAGSDNLKLHLRISGNMQAVQLSSSSIGFQRTQKGRREGFLYDGLNVWDATGRRLDAEMHLDAESNMLTIETSDKNAVYPVTIDPLTHTPEWATSADGLLSSLLSNTQINSALYGYTVTGLGDVNGDGYGDVAVSAPAIADIFSGSGTLASVGAVFVFYGSSTGLSTVPNKTLQPNTAVAGALFGMSVDAGDVTGDGINDIVVGAPLDQISVTIALLHINGSVGKIYVYPGGNLASPNPSNFFTLQLNTTYVGVTNISLNPLFGFSVAVTEDLNGDNKKDILVGSPAYASILNPLIKTGAAFLYLSGAGNSFPTIQSLQAPTFGVLGISIPLLSGINGLLFGYSVDGLGDYNGDGVNDIVVGAPAGVNLSSLTGILSGQILGGQAMVYYGTAGHTGVTTSIGAMLETTSSGLLGNAANLFGFKVKGGKAVNGSRNGSVLAGAPLGGLIPGTLSLSIQSGTVSVFKKKFASPSGVVTPDQVIETPRSSSVLSVLGTLNLNLLFGAAIDNAYDINCDGLPDMVVGEPISSGTNLSQIDVNAVGGSAYVYYGVSGGGYQSVPAWSVSATYGSDLLSVNATALFGFSVAGAYGIKGASSSPRILAGSPSGALDFNGLLNLGNTLGTILNFAAGDNGPGKAYTFDLGACSVKGGSPLPVTLVSFTGEKMNTAVQLTWVTENEINLSSYEVQRSNGSDGFETIGVVFSWDNQLRNTYPFTDKTPFAGTNMYRLKMIDKDGKFTYSNIVTLHFGSDMQNQLIISPNPVTSTIRVVLTGMSMGNYRLQVMNAAGQVMDAKSILVTQYQQTETFSRNASMIPGIYWLSVMDATGKKINTTKILAQ